VSFLLSNEQCQNTEVTQNTDQTNGLASSFLNLPVALLSDASVVMLLNIFFESRKASLCRNCWLVVSKDVRCVKMPL